MNELLINEKLFNSLMSLTSTEMFILLVMFRAEEDSESCNISLKEYYEELRNTSSNVIDLIINDIMIISDTIEEEERPDYFRAIKELLIESISIIDRTSKYMLWQN